jgi:hypothetical protein
MPIDYDLMTSRSIPLAIAWVVLIGLGLWRFKKRGLWLLLGTPMALYWPILAAIQSFSVLLLHEQLRVTFKVRPGFAPA